MCTMISVFVASAANVDGLESWSDACSLRLRRLPGPAPGRDIVVLMTGGHCDCGTPIGAGPGADDGGRLHQEWTARDLRKRGWSDAKIKRAIAQSGEARRRRQERRLAIAVAGLEEWVTFLKGAPTHARLHSIGVFYRNDGQFLAAKHLREARREQLPLASLEPLILARLDEGVLYDFVAPK